MTATKEDINKQKCDGCSDCCRYATVIIEKPKTRLDLEEIIWQILHDIELEIDHEGDWLLTIYQPCSVLDKNGLCSIYDKRPEICRRHQQTECARYSSIQPKYLIKTREEFLEFINLQPELKKIYAHSE
jgi:Fe-S-cluster containining protein